MSLMLFLYRTVIPGDLEWHFKVILAVILNFFYIFLITAL